MSAPKLAPRLKVILLADSAADCQVLVSEISKELPARKCDVISFPREEGEEDAAFFRRGANHVVEEDDRLAIVFSHDPSKAIKEVEDVSGIAWSRFSFTVTAQRAWKTFGANFILPTGDAAGLLPDSHRAFGLIVDYLEARMGKLS